MSRTYSVPIAALVLATAPSIDAATIHVPGDQPTIQEGLSAAVVGDTVLVAPGVYQEHDILMTSGVVLLGNPVNPLSVTIDADRDGRILVCEDTSSGTEVVGITFRRGRATASGYDRGGGLRADNSVVAIANCVFEECESGWGGGIWARNGAVIVRQCTFSQCSAEGLGGGLFLRGGGVADDCVFKENVAHSGGGAHAKDSEIHRCIFLENHARFFGGGLNVWETLVESCWFEGNSSDAEGGGAYGRALATTFENCDFVRNRSTLGGGSKNGAYSQCRFVENNARDGGGVYADDAPLGGVFSECRFFRNNAVAGGGAWTSGPEFSMCEFTENTAEAGGGAVACRLSLGVFEDCTFDSNEAPEGSAILAQSMPLIVRSCTFHGHITGEGGSVLDLLPGANPMTIQRSIIAFSLSGTPVSHPGGPQSPLTVFCTDVYGNADGDWVGPLEGLDDGGANFSADPLFCDRHSGDLTLATGSACLPEQSPCANLVGALGEGCGPVSVEPETWAKIKSRYR